MKLKKFSLTLVLIFSLCIGFANYGASPDASNEFVKLLTHGMGG